MALPAVTESLDDLPEALREHYEERNGRFVLSVTPADGMALENVDGLKSSLSSERKKRTDAEKSLAAFSDLDPDAARDAIAALAEIKEKGEPDTKAAIESALRDAEKTWRKKLETAETERDSARKGLRTSVKSGDFAKAAQEHDAYAHLIDPHLDRMTDVQEVDGKFKTVVLDEYGNQRMGLDERGNGVPMSVSSLVKEMKTQDKWAPMFKPSGVSGSGAQPSSTYKRPTRELTAQEKIDRQYEKTTGR